MIEDDSSKHQTRLSVGTKIKPAEMFSPSIRSRSRTKTKPYKLNKKKALTKKMNVSEYDDFTVEKKSGQVRIKCNTGSYELFKQVLLNYYVGDENKPGECLELLGKYDSSTDTSGLVIEEQVKVYDNLAKDHKFTINLYNTTSSVLVNGRQTTRIFYDKHLPLLIKEVNNRNPQELNNMILKCITKVNSTVSEPEQSSDIDTDKTSIINLSRSAQSYSQVITDETTSVHPDESSDDDFDDYTEEISFSVPSNMHTQVDQISNHSTPEKDEQVGLSRSQEPLSLNYDDTLTKIEQSFEDLITKFRSVFDSDDRKQNDIQSNQVEAQLHTVINTVNSIESKFCIMQQKLIELQNCVNLKLTEITCKMPTYAEVTKVYMRQTTDSSTQTIDEEVIPSNSYTDTTENVITIEDTPSTPTPKCEEEIFLLGDSNVRQIRPKYLFGNNKTTKVELKNKTLQGARYFINNMKRKPKSVIIQCGGNDTENKTEEQIEGDIRELLKTSKRQLPDTDISVCIVFPHTVRYSKRQKVDKMAEQLCKEYHTRYISTLTKLNENSMCTDKKHLNKNGLSVLVGLYRTLPFHNPDPHYMNTTRRGSRDSTYHTSHIRANENSRSAYKPTNNRQTYTHSSPIPTPKQTNQYSEYPNLVSRGVMNGHLSPNPLVNNRLTNTKEGPFSNQTQNSQPKDCLRSVSHDNKQSRVIGHTYPPTNNWQTKDIERSISIPNQNNQSKIHPNTVSYDDIGSYNSDITKPFHTHNLETYRHQNISDEGTTIPPLNSVHNQKYASSNSAYNTAHFNETQGLYNGANLQYPRGEYYQFITSPQYKHDSNANHIPVPHGYHPTIVVNPTHTNPHNGFCTAFQNRVYDSTNQSNHIPSPIYQSFGY